MRGSIDMSLIPPFVEVVRQGSFTKAAALLELPKSTVSRRVSKLEESLGAPLLVRTTRKLRLTEEGEAFFRQVLPAVERVEEAAREMLAQAEEPRGVLRITVPTDYDRLPHMVVSFARRYPEVSVEVNVTGDVVDLVAEGYDLAIRAGRLKDSSLTARKLATVEFRLYASHDYLEANPAPRTLAELAEHSCILFRPRRAASQWTLTGPSGVEKVDPSGQLITNDLKFIQGAVLSGAGIGLLPQHIFASDRARVERVLPDYAMQGGSVHVVYPSTRHVPAKVRAFRDHLLESALWEQ